MTKRQKCRERMAEFLDKIAGGKNKSEYAKQYRAVNRRVDKKKGQTSKIRARTG